MFNNLIYNFVMLMGLITYRLFHGRKRLTRLQYAAYSSPKRSESHCSSVNFINTVRYTQKSGGKINTYQFRQNSSTQVQINKKAE